MGQDDFQEAQMQLHFGADVRGHEDEKLGTLRHVLFDPETDEVTSIVVEHSGFDGRQILVPTGAVDTADHGGVVLALSRDQFDELPEAGESHNIAPPPTADNLETDDDIPPVEVPDVPSVGAATGVESIAFTPIVEESFYAPGQTERLDSDTTIWATDGEVGRLADVMVDQETRRIQGFAVEKGLIFKHDLEVPRDLVAELGPENITLSVQRAAIEAENAHG